MTGVILAGGESRRFPSNKCMAIVAGSTIFERVLGLHRKFFSRIIISTNSPEIFFRFGACIVGDLLTERGSMVGIYSAMISSDDEWFFTTACDMPFISPGLMEYLLSLQRRADAVIPVFEGQPQPLLGLYHRRLIKEIYARITGKKKGLRSFLDDVGAQLVNEEAVREIDPEGRSFININTIEEYMKIQGGEICSG